MNKKELFDKLKSQNIFWSYDVKTSNDISDSIFIEHVLIYADVDEIKDLFKIYDKKEIIRIWNERIIPDERFRRLNYYLSRYFFDIDNFETYLRENSKINSRYEKLKRISTEHQKST